MSNMYKSWQVFLLVEPLGTHQGHLPEQTAMPNGLIFIFACAAMVDTIMKSGIKANEAVDFQLVVYAGLLTCTAHCSGR